MGTRHDPACPDIRVSDAAGYRIGAGVPAAVARTCLGWIMRRKHHEHRDNDGYFDGDGNGCEQPHVPLRGQIMKIRTLLGALVGLLLTQAAFAASTTLSLGTSTGPGGIVLLYGSTSGSVSLQTAAVAGTSTIFQLPATNGSNGNVLQTDGSGVTSWTSAGTGNCTVSSSAGAVFNNGSSACITNTDMTFATGILSLGINTSELGGVKMFGGTSGNVTIEPSAVAGTNLVATLPANTGTISEINLAETFTEIGRASCRER